MCPAIDLGDENDKSKDISTEALQNTKAVSRLKQRKARHRLHFIDNVPVLKEKVQKTIVHTDWFETVISNNGDLHVFEEKHTDENFACYIKEDDSLVLFPPLDKEMRYDVSDVKDLIEELKGFLPKDSSEFNVVMKDIHEHDTSGLTSLLGMKKSTFSNILYQDVREESYYQDKLKKFSGTGYVFEKLDFDEASYVQHLNELWALEKANSVEPLGVNPFSSIDDMTFALDRGLNHYKRMLEIYNSVDDLEKIKSLMFRPITKYYGAKKDGKLLAFTSVDMNDHFAIIRKRCGKRVNGKSPQEFLDYNVFALFAQNGIEEVDRGYISHNRNLTGLLRYKEKFGDLRMRTGIRTAFSEETLDTLIHMHNNDYFMS